MTLRNALRTVDDNETTSDLERAVENALITIGAEKPQQSTSQIKSARDSFARNLQRLQEKIDAVNAEVITATKVRDEAIAQANEQHQAALADAEKKLYQATTLRAVIETAHATLTQARDE